MILVIGGINLDLLAKSKKFERGVSNPSRIRIGVGGVGYNISKAIGDDAFFVYPIADDDVGYLIRRRIEVNGKPIVLKNSRSGLYISLVQDGEILYSAVDNPSAEMVNAEEILRVVEDLNIAYEDVVIDTNFLLNTLERLISHFRIKGKRVFLDAVSPAKLERSMKILNLVDAIHVNGDEFKRLCRFLNLSDLTGGYDVLLSIVAEKFGFDILLLSLGDEGVWVKYDETVEFVDVKPMDVEDTTGAGDYLFGRFIYHLSTGLQVMEALEKAVEECEKYLKMRIISHDDPQIPPPFR